MGLMSEEFKALADSAQITVFSSCPAQEDTPRSCLEDESKFTFWSYQPFLESSSACPLEFKDSNTSIFQIIGMCSGFRSYRRNRRFETNLHRFLISRKAFRIAEPNRLILFRGSAQSEYDPEEPPNSVESCESARLVSSGRPILRERIASGESSTDQFTLEPLREFLEAIEALLVFTENGVPICSGEMKQLIQFGSRHCNVIANNLAVMLELALTSCKQFTELLRRLLALAIHVMLIFDDKEGMMRNSELQEFFNQTQQSYKDCDSLMNDLRSLAFDLSQKRDFWTAHCSTMVTHINEVSIAHAVMDKIFEHYEKTNDEFDFSNEISNSPNLELYKNAIQFLLCEEPKLMTGQLEDDMSQVIADTKELEGAVVTIMRNLEDSLY